MAEKQVVLIGYSFGADVLPFVLANLPKEQQTAVKHIVLLGLSRFAHFEFYLTNWLSSETRESPFATEEALKTLPSVAGLCVQGAEDEESICSQLKLPNIKSVTLPGTIITMRITIASRALLWRYSAAVRPFPLTRRIKGLRRLTNLCLMAVLEACAKVILPIGLREVFFPAIFSTLAPLIRLCGVSPSTLEPWHVLQHGRSLLPGSVIGNR